MQMAYADGYRSAFPLRSLCPLLSLLHWHRSLFGVLPADAPTAPRFNTFFQHESRFMENRYRPPVKLVYHY